MRVHNIQAVCGTATDVGLHVQTCMQREENHLLIWAENARQASAAMRLRDAFGRKIALVIQNMDEWHISEQMKLLPSPGRSDLFIFLVFASGVKSMYRCPWYQQHKQHIYVIQRTAAVSCSSEGRIPPLLRIMEEALEMSAEDWRRVEQQSAESVLPHLMHRWTSECTNSRSLKSMTQLAEKAAMDSDCDLLEHNFEHTMADQVRSCFHPDWLSRTGASRRLIKRAGDEDVAVERADAERRHSDAAEMYRAAIRNVRTDVSMSHGYMESDWDALQSLNLYSLMLNGGLSVGAYGTGMMAHLALAQAPETVTTTGQLQRAAEQAITAAGLRLEIDVRSVDAFCASMSRCAERARRQLHQ
jgi:hypothetical protein